MTKVQMHVFNWFFLFIMAAVVVVHVLTAYFLNVSVGAAVYIFLAIFALIWLVFYGIQIKAFSAKKRQISIVINGLLTGFWVIVYVFINMK